MAMFFPGDEPISRRRFASQSAVLAAGAFSFPMLKPSAAKASSRIGRLAFEKKDAGFPFDTGQLAGILHAEGRSRGLVPVQDTKSETAVAGRYGLFSHYRLLDSQHRYGTAGWDWASRARLLPDGRVIVQWMADQAHPFDMEAEYRWAAPGTLDLTTRITARQPLRCLEVFLASYFADLPESRVYVKQNPEDGGNPGLMEAKRSYGMWQMYPRDDAAVRTIQDSRWTRPPNPVDWKIMPHLKCPLALRRRPGSGLTALVMAPAGDCFAVATPFGQEPHGSLYLSLFGTDFAQDLRRSARARLVIADGISDEQAIAMSDAYQAAEARSSTGDH